MSENKSIQTNNSVFKWYIINGLHIEFVCNKIVRICGTDNSMYVRFSCYGD